MDALTRNAALPHPQVVRPLAGVIARLRYHLPLVPALLAALYMYSPAVRSPFLGDDYLLLLSSRDVPIGRFVQSAVLPWADPGTLQLGDHYWRPLSFLTFRGIYAVFGANPIPYHLFSIGVHLATVALVYLLALRLTRSRLGAATAAFVMAVDWAGFESITWIAALNSAGLPFALGAWLAFLHATARPGRPRIPWLAVSVALEAVALGFRETSVVIVAAMLLCYLLCEARHHLRERSTWLVIAPAAVLAAFHAIALAGIATPGRGESLVGVDGNTLHVFWFYVKQTVPTEQVDSGSPVAWFQRAVGVAILALPVAALICRRWRVAALGIAFLASLVPYALFDLGFGPRYFYFPTAILALLAGAVTTGLAEAPALQRRQPVTGRLAAAALVAVLTLGALYGQRRVSTWAARNPDQNERWVAQLHAQYPTLPDGAGVYVVGTPLFMSLLQGYILEPIVAYEYPGSRHRVYMIDTGHIAFARSVMGPNDRMFIYHP